MYKYLAAITIITICLFGQTFSYQEDVPFETYLEYIQAVSKFGSHLSPVQIELAYSTISDKTCTREEDEENFYLDPICLLQKEFPTLEFTQVIDLLYESIEWFNQVYNSAPTESFNYEGGAPIYKDNISRDYLLVQNTQAHKAIATFHSIEENKIKIPKSIVAQIIAQDYTFYAAYNDISMRRGCSLKNYEVALHSMDKVFLYPWDTFNFNTHISDREYCKWSWPQNLQFYGGVCWAASQLFRTSLLLPWIQVTQRYGHSERWAKYYGDDVTGDDAAIYQMHKQLEIKNNDTRWLYFRTIQSDKHSYLIAISPYKTDLWIKIQRENTSPLKTVVTRSIYNKVRWNTIQNDIFETKYTRKNNNSN